MKKKIVFIAPPFSGHLFPQIEVANFIKEDYDIVFLTAPTMKKILDEVGFRNRIFLKSDSLALDKVANTEKPVRSNPFKLWIQFNNGMKLFNKVVEEIKEILKDEKPDLVVSDFVAIHGGVVAKELGIPWITTIPTPLAIENIDGTPSYVGGLIPKNSNFGKIRDYFLRKTVRITKRLFFFSIKKNIKDHMFNFYRKDGTEAIYSDKLILALGISELEFKRTWPKSLVWIGACCNSPIDKIDDFSLEDNNYKKKVFITLGTHLYWKKEVIFNESKELAKKFPDICFVLSMGLVNKSKKEVQLENLKNEIPNLILVDYLSYNKHLHKFDVVIHHGGAGILYNTLKFGKPAIILPQDYDQFDYAARLSYYKCGIIEKNLNSKSTFDSLTKILNGELDEGVSKFKNIIASYDTKKIVKEEISKILGEK